LAQQQQALRERLQGIIQGLGPDGQKAAGDLAGAGESMNRAEGDLSGNQFGNAAQAQQDALERLRQAGQQMAQADQKGKQNGDGQTLDPLGRPVGANGQLLGGMLNNIDQGDLQRAREILDELRKRAAELGRSTEELDYIDRLLKLF